ncbi:hypothetical protein NLJ89_g5015 [Agrocybe chaxingu]|uniref:Uncharacterized protein n=1 Tax=Agrocybe chaxingu TaxID=84603 RepID=A0A9W8K1F8_9AGAR|nr:hypothetical protein NLJ89_g5015 [Agrocybe chaxingu]
MEGNRPPAFLPRLAPHLFHNRRPAVNHRRILGTSTPPSPNSNTSQLSTQPPHVTDVSSARTGPSVTLLIRIFTQLRLVDAAFAADAFCGLYTADPSVAVDFLAAVVKAAEGSEDGAGQLLVFFVQALQDRDLFAALICRVLHPEA